MFAAELHIPPWRIGDLTIDQLREAVAWCRHEQARRQDQG